MGRTKQVEKSGVPANSLARGLRLRRALVGRQRTEKADAGFDAALIPAREILLEHVWGKVWTRRTLDRRSRSLMTLAVLTALNRPQELTTHLHVAAANGLSRAEVGEAILHAAAYCGVPAGMGALAIARQVFKEQDEAAGRKGHRGANE